MAATDMKLNDSIEIISVKLMSLDNDTETLLYERANSRCHFARKFDFDDCRIQLRLDC